jgi:hypothetical protein
VYGPNPAVPTQTPLTVRIEQFGPLPDDLNMNLFTHWFALEDFLLPNTGEYYPFECTFSVYTYDDAGKL